MGDCSHPRVIFATPQGEWMNSKLEYVGETESYFFTSQAGYPCPDHPDLTWIINKKGLRQEAGANVTKLIVVDCELADWSEWTPCSVSCGGGKSTRERHIKVEAKNGGACEGTTHETQDCQPEPCIVDCERADWSEWTPCSVSC